MLLIARLRHAPLGILLIAALFAMMGAASIAGGGYLLLDTGSVTLWEGAVALVVGPAVIYLSYHLVQFASWTWLALVVVLALLFLSSLARVAVAESFPTAALGELIIEALVARYLLRPDIRARFGWSPRTD